MQLEPVTVYGGLLKSKGEYKMFCPSCGREMEHVHSKCRFKDEHDFICSNNHCWHFGLQHSGLEDAPRPVMIAEEWDYHKFAPYYRESIPVRIEYLKVGDKSS